MASVKKEDPLEKLGFRTAGAVIESFKNRRVHFIEPLGLALSTNRVDPINGLPGLPRGSQIELFAPPGKGKCFRKGTQVLRFDGSLANVEDVKVGDQVMGPDSKPRNVLSLGRGNETMYEVKPVKGEPFYCNESHILSLRRSSNLPKMDYRKVKEGKRALNPQYPGQEIVNVSVKEYLTWSNTRKGMYKLYRSEAVEFSNGPEYLIVDPYMLGIWLGDGTKADFSITTADNEIKEYIHEYAYAVNKPTRSEEKGSILMDIFN